MSSGFRVLGADRRLSRDDRRTVRRAVSRSRAEAVEALRNLRANEESARRVAARTAAVASERKQAPAVAGMLRRLWRRVDG